MIQRLVMCNFGNWTLSIDLGLGYPRLLNYYFNPRFKDRYSLNSSMNTIYLIFWCLEDSVKISLSVICSGFND